MPDNPCVNCKKEKSKCIPCITPCTENAKEKKSENPKDQSKARHGTCDCANVKYEKK